MVAIIVGTVLYVIIFAVAAFFIQDYVTKQTDNEKIKSEWRWYVLLNILKNVISLFHKNIL